MISFIYSLRKASNDAFFFHLMMHRYFSGITSLKCVNAFTSFSNPITSSNLFRFLNVIDSLPLLLTEIIWYIPHTKSSGGTREIQRTMLELLNQLDGFDERGDVKVREWRLSQSCNLSPCQSISASSTPHSSRKYHSSSFSAESHFNRRTFLLIHF